MAVKRKPGELEDVASQGVSIMTADMADDLRAELIARTERRNKKQRLRTKPAIDVSYEQQEHNRASFLGLPRELRDEVYHYLWNDTPLIRQRYQRKTYTVTYGERHDLLGHVVHSGKAMWLLANKQMMVEGLEEFHRRSIWIFEYSSKTAKTQYIFPPMTPARVHEQHLYVSGPSRRWLGARGLRVRRVRLRLSGSPPCQPRIVRAKSITVGLANIMTTSTDAGDAVQKIKLYMIADGAQVHKLGRGPGGAYGQGTQIFDFSKLDRLAVHRKLRVLDVQMRTSVNMQYHNVESLKTTVANLITEMRNVGEALVPGGTAAEVDVAAGWPMERGINCCQLVVNKI